MLEVLSDPGLHSNAAKGFKYVGQSVELHGSEDALICREAGTFWNEPTTDGYQNMRPKIDGELAAVAEEYETGGLLWTSQDIKGLIMPYPPNKCDRVLSNLGADFYHDELHELEDEDTAAAEEGDNERGAPSDTSTDVDEERVSAAVPENVGAIVPTAAAEHTNEPLCGAQADAVHQAHETMVALESAMDSLRAVGAARGAQCVEAELRKMKRREREMVRTKPAVADAFLRLRANENREQLAKKRIADEQRERKREVAKAISDKDAAVAELRKTRRLIQQMESTRAMAHAIKTFTLESLGDEDEKAGGAKAKKNRLEVLDRLKRLNAGLSPGQINDWPWFKNAWDDAMVAQHKGNWAALFSSWVQGVLDDTRSNAFSMFVFNETRRVFQGTTALHVPG